MKFKQNNIYKVCRTENVGYSVIIISIINSVSSYKLYEVGTIFSILHRRQSSLREFQLREVRSLAQGHTASNDRTDIQIQEYLAPLPKCDTVSTHFPN